MKQKRPHGAVLLFFGVLLGGLHVADLLFWTDPATGFATAGSVWARYIPWLAALLLPYLPARRAAAQPADLAESSPMLGAFMLLTGMALVASGVLTLSVIWYALQNPALWTGYLQISAWADAITSLLAGLWMIGYGVRAFAGYGIRRERLGRPIWIFGVFVYYLWRLGWRFQMTPASLARLPCTLRVLSAAAALLFVVVLFKVFLIPGYPCGHTLFAVGSGCFLLCTCLELPQTLFEAAYGMLTLPDLLTGLGFGTLGLCGFVCAWAATGEDITEQEEM